MGGAGGGDRAVLPQVGLERMLRMVVAQQCFGLSDEGIADALYDSQAIRRCVGIDLAREAAPDATTLPKFRRRLEDQGLTGVIFATINDHLARQGLLLREGTLVDATLIAAPPSTRNRDRARDPAMHAAQKGRQWHFGMKAHVGVDADSGLVHTRVTTPAHVHDVTQSPALLQGQERHTRPSSIRSTSSRTCSSTTRRAIGGWRGIRRSCRSCLDWPTW